MQHAPPDGVPFVGQAAELVQQVVQDTRGETDQSQRIFVSLAAESFLNPRLQQGGDRVR
jgi:hypothetical protein